MNNTATDLNPLAMINPKTANADRVADDTLYALDYSARSLPGAGFQYWNSYSYADLGWYLGCNVRD